VSPLRNIIFANNLSREGRVGEQSGAVGAPLGSLQRKAREPAELSAKPYQGVPACMADAAAPRNNTTLYRNSILHINKRE